VIAARRPGGALAGLHLPGPVLVGDLEDVAGPLSVVARQAGTIFRTGANPPRPRRVRSVKT